MGYAIVWLINTLLSLATWAIILTAILSWLFAFDIINHRNRFVGQLAYFLERVTSPILDPLRRVIPSLGGIDITPIVALLALQFIKILFMRTLAPILMGL